MFEINTAFDHLLLLFLWSNNVKSKPFSQLDHSDEEPRSLGVGGGETGKRAYLSSGNEANPLTLVPDFPPAPPMLGILETNCSFPTPETSGIARTVREMGGGCRALHAGTPG